MKPTILIMTIMPVEANSLVQDAKDDRATINGFNLDGDWPIVNSRKKGHELLDKLFDFYERQDQEGMNTYLKGEADGRR